MLHRSCAARRSTLRHTSCCPSAYASFCQHCPRGRKLLRFNRAAVLLQAGPGSPAAAAAAAAAASARQPNPQRGPAASQPQNRRILAPAAAPPTAPSQKTVVDAAAVCMSRGCYGQGCCSVARQIKTFGPVMPAGTVTPAATGLLTHRHGTTAVGREQGMLEPPAVAARRRAAPAPPPAPAAASFASRSRPGPRQAPGLLRGR